MNINRKSFKKPTIKTDDLQLIRTKVSVTFADSMVAKAKKIGSKKKPNKFFENTIERFSICFNALVSYQLVVKKASDF